MAIEKLLIANRGEIACRIIQTAKDMGIRTVAVYSEADANAPHVMAADETVLIGPGPVNESYLVVDHILEAAITTGADAIHPGYGFLSENAVFARAVADAGLIFVGPSPEAISIMGDKAGAKRMMIASGVPCIPGYEGEDQSNAYFIDAAADIGYPVMVKASAGGGGRGMRLVASSEGLETALELARSEAENAFGNGALILEKAIFGPRHVEIQVFADRHGNCIHLGERDCSVQRRHQKVIEEAPCPVMTPELRAAMGKAAIDAAKAVNYVGAGTVEFLLDAERNFYFLEMNTRLQVEHPVTEAVTGLDLVALQLRVANGEPLMLSQDDIALNGHAIEVRLYAEDPANGFLPSTGHVYLFSVPEGPGIRVDAGIETGGEVSPFYDPMVAKVIAHGASRHEALRKLVGALQGTALFGPRSNRDFLINALQREAFAEGNATTSFIADSYGDGGFCPSPPDKASIAAATLIDFVHHVDEAEQAAIVVQEELSGWSSVEALPTYFSYAIDGETIVATVQDAGDHYAIDVGAGTQRAGFKAYDSNTATMVLDDSVHSVTFLDTDTEIHLATEAQTLKLSKLDRLDATIDDAQSDGRVTAPMHGKLLEVFVSEGLTVEKGARLAILEAMKMQHEILADIAGSVQRVEAVAGVQIAAGDLILEIELAGDNA